MKNEQIFKNHELIPLLIKYVEVNKIIFPIEKVKYLSNEEIIISNSEDISLLNDITYLKSIGLVNFAIDGRWRDENYLNKIQEYNTAIDK